MAETYYDNSDEGQRFQPGTTAEGEAVDQKFDAVATGFYEVEKDTRRSLKFPFEAGMPSQEFSATTLQRRNRVLGFDTDGNLALVSGFFNRGDWQPNTDYFLNDVVRDPDTTNLYVLIVAKHTSGATPAFGNTSLWYLAIDADTVRTARIAAEAARDLAEQWASSFDPVENGYRGAIFYALDARGSEQAARGYRDETAAAESRVETLEQSATDAASTATTKAGEASDSAAAAAQSESSIQGVESNVTATAQQVADDAQTASDAADEAALVAQNINDTTTMDFLNFELSGPDLIAHFAGYSDASNFSVNAAGELEVTL
ncbi:hypothetical protein [Halomonas koreensis]|uniref:Uncharacterized protein n=1 Tax=Halomonas koreensis TaxID=245385 RepID=A0ABU1G4P7_9GAMM|nr:hypothetical protein [Halomonas koreensis]MDR5867925.1 hypothetical protein [Halomonas koreensis]